jgi:hypothetical protein
MGYTTCHWHTVSNSVILFDRWDWFAQLQNHYDQPYPAQLKRNIIAKNHPILRNVIPSYLGQIKKALTRSDLVSINHRVAALFASYFDVLFALNEAKHPGEKKLLKFVGELCPKSPPTLEAQIQDILHSAGVGSERLLVQLDELIDGLDELLKRAGFEPGETLTLK